MTLKSERKAFEELRQIVKVWKVKKCHGIDTETLKP